MMLQVAQYEPIIRQCEHAYTEAFPEGTFLMTREVRWSYRFCKNAEIIDFPKIRQFTRLSAAVDRAALLSQIQ